MDRSSGKGHHDVMLWTALWSDLGHGYGEWPSMVFTGHEAHIGCREDTSLERRGQPLCARPRDRSRHSRLHFIQNPERVGPLVREYETGTERLAAIHP